MTPLKRVNPNTDINALARLGLARLLALAFVLFASAAPGQRLVTFSLTDRSAQVQADLYGSGIRGLILAHGGRFHKESWKKQAAVLANRGFLVLALGFRGDGFNPDGSPGSFGSDAENSADVMAAVSYLRQVGAKTVSAVGASMGGDAVGEANSTSAMGTFERIVFLASSGGDAPMKLSGRKLYIVARDDRNSEGLRLPEISRHYEKAQQPKRLVILEGSAHAQFLFDTEQGPRLLDEIVRFLSAP